MWTGPDARLTAGSAGFPSGTAAGGTLSGFQIQSYERDWLRSPLVIANTLAQGQRLPDYSSGDRIYDDGGAQIFRAAPNSPFEN